MTDPYVWYINGNIYHQYTPNVSIYIYIYIYIPYMDPSWDRVVDNDAQADKLGQTPLFIACDLGQDLRSCIEKA